jgi:hypothetical protein
MRTLAISILVYVGSFFVQSYAFGFDFNAHLFNFPPDTYSLLSDIQKGHSLRLGGDAHKTIYYPTSSSMWKIQFGYVGKNEASESIFFDTSGQPLFKHYQKQADPYANRNLQNFLRSQEKEGMNFQMVYFFPYFHVEGKEYTCKFAQVVRVTAMQCEWKF